MISEAEIYRRLDAYKPPEGAHRPLKATFRLAAPVSQAYPWIRGDALLAAVLLRDVLGNAAYRLPTKRVLPLDEHLTLPLSRSYENIVPGGVWHASASVMDTDMKRTTRQYKRFDTQNTDVLHGIKKRKVEMNMGYYKAGLTTLAYAPANEVLFYFHGHEGEVRRLLEHVTHLGKNRASGYGEVIGVTVEEIPRDRSLYSDGVVMRPIPYECVPGATLDQCAQLTYGLPAWDHSRAVPCIPPGTAIECMTPIDSAQDVDFYDGAVGVGSATPGIVGATGNWFVTPHAVQRYQQRVEPGLTYEQALARLIDLSNTARYVKTYERDPDSPSEKYRNGYELWRGPRPRRLRCWIAQPHVEEIAGHKALPQLVTVFAGDDR